MSPARGPSRKVASSVDDREKLVADYMKLTPDEKMAKEKKIWTRSAPADLYYERGQSKINGTPRLATLLDNFQEKVLDSAAEARELQPKYQPPKTNRLKVAKCRPSKGCCGQSSSSDKCSDNSSGTSSSSEGDDDDDDDDNLKDSSKNEAFEWLEHRAKQPFRLSSELWDNIPNELNDGPACRCSLKARRIGIRHGTYYRYVPTSFEHESSEKLILKFQPKILVKVCLILSLIA